VPAPIPIITVCHLGFEELATFADKAVVDQMRLMMGMSKKMQFRKSVKYDRCHVSRAPASITIHLLLGEVETGRFTFVPTPDFKRE
jgi:hypothetical protein